MLIHLHVKNLALIEEAEVDFGPGLNILTGETGAGKSILLGSMQLILGGKMSKEMIREKSDYALVELLFQVENPLLSQRLSELDIPLEEADLAVPQDHGRKKCQQNQWTDLYCGTDEGGGRAFAGHPRAT